MLGIEQREEGPEEGDSKQRLTLEETLLAVGTRQLGECLLSMDLAEGDWGSWGHQHLSASCTPNLDPVSTFHSVSFSGKCLSSTAGPTLVCFQEVSLHLTKPSTSLKSLAPSLKISPSAWSKGKKAMEKLTKNESLLLFYILLCTSEILSTKRT